MNQHDPQETTIEEQYHLKKSPFEAVLQAKKVKTMGSLSTNLTQLPLWEALVLERESRKTCHRSSNTISFAHL